MIRPVASAKPGDQGLRSPRPESLSSPSGGPRLALSTPDQRNAWLDAQLETLSKQDQATIARACELLDNIAIGASAPTLP